MSADGVSIPLEIAMADAETRYTLDRVIRTALTAVTVAGVVLLLRYLSDVLLPFAAAVVLAYLLNPLVTIIERKTKRRGLAVAITIGGLGTVGLTVVLLIVPLMIGQVRQFGDILEQLRSDLASSVRIGADVDVGSAVRTDPADASSIPPGESDTVDGRAAPAPRGGRRTAKSATGWRELKEAWARYRKDAAAHSRSQRLARLREQLSGTYLGDLLDRGIQYTESAEFNQLIVDAAKRVAVGGWTAVTFFVNLALGLTGLIVVLLYLVFLLLDFPEYARTWATFLPPQYRETIVEFGEQFEVALRRYFRGQSVVALLVGTLFAIGFTIIGLPMAVPFGLFVGLLNMVPYLQVVGLVPAMMLAGLRAIDGDSSFVISVALTLLVFAVVQTVQDTLITPRVIGKAMGLRPVAILLGIFIWGKLLGFMGLLLAIPLTCLGIAYYRRFVLMEKRDQKPVRGAG